MKRILIASIAAGSLFLGAAFSLAHGEETPSAPKSAPAPANQIQSLPAGPNASKALPPAIWPYVKGSSPKMRIRDSKSCREYLTICERSCRGRGEMFKFQCIGKDFQPFQDHFRCQCADDLYQQGSAQPIQVRQQ